MSVFVILALWPDNSGDPRLVRAYMNKALAERALQLVAACEPTMMVSIVEVPYEDA
jgi:hypothetical protein